MFHGRKSVTWGLKDVTKWWQYIFWRNYYFKLLHMYRRGSYATFYLYAHNTFTLHFCIILITLFIWHVARTYTLQINSLQFCSSNELDSQVLSFSQGRTFFNSENCIVLNLFFFYVGTEISHMPYRGIIKCAWKVYARFASKTFSLSFN